MRKLARPLEKIQWLVAYHVLPLVNMRPKGSSGGARSEGQFWRQQLVHRFPLHDAQWEKGPVSGHQRQRKPRVGQRQRDLWQIVADYGQLMPWTGWVRGDRSSCRAREPRCDRAATPL